MNLANRILNFFTVFVFVAFVSCNNKDSSIELQSLDLLRGDLVLCSGDEFGKSSFAFTCDYSVRRTFDIAISLLHSFEYDEAERAFVNVIDVDPDCAMAYWGVAMSIYHALWFAPGEIDLIKGSQILEIAKSIPMTDMERDYLDAIGAYYKDWETIGHKERAKSMELAMERIYTKYPEHTEAAIFYALALKSTADKTDKTYKNEKKAGAILEALFPDQPNHPGIAHYIIHHYDNPDLAHLALSTAKKYAEIAPASAHAQHMPSHIFTRLGMWDESINSNISSASSAKCYAQQSGIKGTWDQEIHAIDYLVYAYLQKGDNEMAAEQYEYIKTMNEVSPPSPAVAYPFAAIPARMTLENKDWESASKIEIHASELDWNKFPWQKAIIHFARSLGASHIGDFDLAFKEMEVLNELHRQLENNENMYLGNQVAIQMKTAEAWLEWAQGNKEEGLDLMKSAASMEDNTAKHPVTPGEVVPAREFYGDMLLLANRPEAALVAYEEDLKGHPNRFNGIYGAASAAKKIGNIKKAKHYFGQLISLSSDISTERKEVKEAKYFIEKVN